MMRTERGAGEGVSWVVSDEESNKTIKMRILEKSFNVPTTAMVFLRYITRTPILHF